MNDKDKLRVALNALLQIEKEVERLAFNWDLDAIKQKANFAIKVINDEIK